MVRPSRMRIRIRKKKRLRVNLSRTFKSRLKGKGLEKYSIVYISQRTSVPRKREDE